MLYLKYYPKTFDDIVGNDNMKNIFSIMLKKQKFSNLILNGYNGCGKSTFIKIFLKHIKNYKIIELNPSNIINDLDNIMKEVRIVGDKIILIDNCIDLNIKLQKVVNNIMNVANKSIFIICTNNIDSIIDSFKTKFFLLNFEYINDDLLFNYFRNIADTEKLDITDKKIKQIIFYSRNDYRKILNSISIHEDIDFSYEDILMQILISSDLYENINNIKNLYDNGHSCLNIIKSFKTLIKLKLDLNDLDIDLFVEKINHLTEIEINIYNGNDDFSQLILLITKLT